MGWWEDNYGSGLSDADEEFESEECRTWYTRHGITHRGGYLFHGPPGCGKTSTIAAIAGHLQRRVHRVSLVAPHLTDDSLSLAMAEVRAPATQAMARC